MDSFFSLLFLPHPFVAETVSLIKLLKAGLLAPLGALFNVAVQVVILIALVLLICKY